MRTLIFMRHATSGRNHVPMDDFDRPLTAGGRSEAPVMAQKIARRSIRPDLIVSSPAVRALTTARLVAQAMALPHDTVREEPALYEASVDHYLEVINALPDEVHCAMLIGHNPALTELVNVLAPASVGEMPPSGVAAVGITADSWGEVRKSSGKLLFVEEPLKDA